MNSPRRGVQSVGEASIVLVAARMQRPESHAQRVRPPRGPTPPPAQTVFAIMATKSLLTLVSPAPGAALESIVADMFLVPNPSLPLMVLACRLAVSGLRGNDL